MELTTILWLFINTYCVLSHPLCSQKQTCGTLTFGGVVWNGNGEVGTGLKVGEFTDNQLQWIGCIGSNPGCNFFCSQSETSMTFGANFGALDYPRMTALLGENFPSVDSSGDCSTTANMDQQSAAFIDDASAVKLCQQLGYATGTINECNTASGCPLVAYDATDGWTLTGTTQSKTLENMTCSGCTSDGSDGMFNKQIVVNVNNYIYNKDNDKCCDDSSSSDDDSSTSDDDKSPDPAVQSINKLDKFSKSSETPTISYNYNIELSDSLKYTMCAMLIILVLLLIMCIYKNYSTKNQIKIDNGPHSIV